MAMERLAEQPIIDKTDESTKLLGSTQGLNDNGEAVDTVRRIPFNLVAEALSKLGVFITVNESNIIGVTKNLGTFECVAIDDATNKYTFAVADTSIFVSSTEYKVTLDAVDYIVRTSKINEDTVVFVAVNDAVPFVVGNSYTIVFETVNATALGKGNTVLAHNALGAGYNNKIDEKGDQSATFGYGHEVSGKNQMAAGYNHDILGGEANFVAGGSNKAKGYSKLVAGRGLESILTTDGAAVLGKYNVDVENALFILGGGADKYNRKNIIVIDEAGNTAFAGSLSVDGAFTLNGNAKISGNVEIARNLNIIDGLSAMQIIADTITTKDQMNTKYLSATESVRTKEIYASGNVIATGEVTGSNIFPITKKFTINGDITNADTGEVVANRNGGNDINFNIFETDYGMDGTFIKLNKKLRVPIDTVLQPGTYNINSLSYSGDFRLHENQFVLSLPDFDEKDVVINGENIIVKNAVQVNEVYLTTEIADDDIYFGEWGRFRGYGTLSLALSMKTDITTELIGAATEDEVQDIKKEVDILESQMGDIETALDSIIEIQNSLIGGEEV